MNSKGVPAPAQTLVHDLLDGARAYAAFTGFSERRCFYLLEKRQLPGGKLGGRWVGSKTAVRQVLANIMSGEGA